MSRIGMVWAEARDGAIGRSGEIPWHVPEDLAHFKEVTVGAPVVMGRLTWESLPERFRPLPGRENIVVSRSADYVAAGARVVTSLDEALGDQRLQVWIMGGGQLYREGMPLAEELYVTRIDVKVPEADTFAPEIGDEWQLADAGEPLISRSGVGYRFERWVRTASSRAAAVA